MRFPRARLQVSVPALIFVLYLGFDPRSLDDLRVGPRAKQLRDAWVEYSEVEWGESVHGYTRVTSGPPPQFSIALDAASRDVLGRLGLSAESEERIRAGLRSRRFQPFPGLPRRAQVSIQLLEPIDGQNEMAAFIWQGESGLLVSFRLEDDHVVVLRAELAGIWCS